MTGIHMLGHARSKVGAIKSNELLTVLHPYKSACLWSQNVISFTTFLGCSDSTYLQLPCVGCDCSSVYSRVCCINGVPATDVVAVQILCRYPINWSISCSACGFACWLKCSAHNMLKVNGSVLGFCGALCIGVGSVPVSEAFDA